VFGRGWRGPLGSIDFGPDGRPGSTITVNFGDVVTFVRDAHVLGVSDWRWPGSLRERILGRVIGRVIAHEIGHFLLEMPEHAASGLMASTHTADTLVAPSRRPFELTRAERSRLADAARKEKGPALAGPDRQTTAKP
jgi:hypothetical protein